MVIDQRKNTPFDENNKSKIVNFPGFANINTAMITVEGTNFYIKSTAASGASSESPVNPS